MICSIDRLDSDNHLFEIPQADLSDSYPVIEDDNQRQTHHESGGKWYRFLVDYRWL
jgi:hypothetical protein